MPFRVDPRQIVQLVQIIWTTSLGQRSDGLKPELEMLGNTCVGTRLWPRASRPGTECRSISRQWIQSSPLVLSQCDQDCDHDVTGGMSHSVSTIGSSATTTSHAQSLPRLPLQSNDAHLTGQSQDEAILPKPARHLPDAFCAYPTLRSARGHKTPKEAIGFWEPSYAVVCIGNWHRKSACRQFPAGCKARRVFAQQLWSYVICCAQAEDETR